MEDTLTLSTPAPTTSLDLSDYFELTTLLRAIMEAKFSGHGPDTELVGSPVLASTANRIVETLIALEKSRGSFSAAKWQSWRKLNPSRREWSLIIKRIRAVTKWKEWTTDERIKFLEILASPLTLSEEHRDTLLYTK